MTDNKIREIRVIRENSRFRRYPEYKDSGVEWIGEIPRYWEVKRLKYIADLNMGQSPPSEEYNSDQIGTPFLQGNAEFGMHHPTPKIYCPTAKKHANPGDILLSVRAPVGAINIANQEYGIGRGLCAIRPRTNQFERRYAKYLLEIVRAELHVVATGSTYEAVTVDEVSNLTCVVPPLSKQCTIANFLDRKTEQIDELIRIKDRRIELLQEQRTALINQVVTKGLDRNVEMKPSGVEWIGEIPAHWEVVRSKHLFGNRNQRGYESEPLLSVTQDQGVLPRNELDYRVWNPNKNIKLYKLVKPGDWVISLRTFEGGIELSEVRGIVSAAYTTMFPQRQIFSSYFKHLLKSVNFIAELNRITTGIRQGKNISYEDFSDTKIAFPPLNEQKVIGDFLNRKTGQIDELIATEQRKIELLKEYRQSLISEAVTGKIDVRGAV